MKMDCITFRSITPAQRAQRVLRQGGVDSAMQRTPRPMTKQGCGYCLRVRSDRREMALALLDRAGVAYTGTFPVEQDRRVAP